MPARSIQPHYLKSVTAVRLTLFASLQIKSVLLFSATKIRFQWSHYVCYEIYRLTLQQSDSDRPC